MSHRDTPSWCMLVKVLVRDARPSIPYEGKVLFGQTASFYNPHKQSACPHYPNPFTAVFNISEPASTEIVCEINSGSFDVIAIFPFSLEKAKWHMANDTPEKFMDRALNVWGKRQKVAAA